jgi:hypothetical protein
MLLNTVLHCDEGFGFAVLYPVMEIENLTLGSLE